jgi:hypothetical protein
MDDDDDCVVVVVVVVSTTVLTPPKDEEHIFSHFRSQSIIILSLSPSRRLSLSLLFQVYMFITIL